MNWKLAGSTVSFTTSVVLEKKLRKYVHQEDFCLLIFFFLYKKEESEFKIYCTLRARGWA